jgi:response regulator RpfG family c-di-GMP phosphodiesterase
MEVPAEHVSAVEAAARFHEIGKLAIPEAILYKPAKLTAEEFAVFRTYPLRGYEMIREEQSLAETAEIVYFHRERFDGRGYPRHLKGEAIPLGARIVAVTEAFDDLVSDRPHRPRHAVECARDQVRRWSGTCFDPEVVESFAQISNEVWQIAQLGSQL